MTKLVIDRSTVEQALEAFRMCVPMDGKHAEVDAAFKTLRAALAEPVQEPVKQCMAHGECFGGECIYQRPAEPVQGPWEHLKQYGYAPGDYMSRCRICDELAYGVDKRAITCRPCAEIRFAESQKVQEPVADRAAFERHDIV